MLRGVGAHGRLPHPAAPAVARAPLVAEHGRFPCREGQHQAAPVPVFRHVGQACLARGLGVEPALRREGARAQRERAGLRRQHAREHLEQLALAVARDARDADDLARRAAAATRRPGAACPCASRQFRPRASSSGAAAAAAARDARHAARLHAAADHGLRQRVDAGVGDRAVEHHGARRASPSRRRTGAMISLSLCVISRTVVPRARRARSVSNSCSVSCGVSTAVGSSRIRMRAPRNSALRISRRWRSPTGSCSTGRSSRTCRPLSLHQRFEARAHLRARVGQPPVRLGAEQDVVERGKRLDQHEVLVHHADAQRDGLVRAADLRGLAFDLDLAAVGLVEAVQDRHQRALAGAVLAHHAVHRAGRHGERDFAVGVDRAEVLVDARMACARAWAAGKRAQVTADQCLESLQALSAM